MGHKCGTGNNCVSGNDDWVFLNNNNDLSVPGWIRHFDEPVPLPNC